MEEEGVRYPCKGRLVTVLPGELLAQTERTENAPEGCSGYEADGRPPRAPSSDRSSGLIERSGGTRCFAGAG